MKQQKNRKENVWQFISLSLAIAIGLIFVFVLLSGLKSNEFAPNESLLETQEWVKEIEVSQTPLAANACSKVKATPAWYDLDDMKIISYGYKSGLSIETLENQNIAFLYDPDCPHCLRQIRAWGQSEFRKLVVEGLAVDCTKEW